MNELSLSRQEQAALIHNRILANGQIAAQALVAMCKDLKQMRDEKLYEELHYSSFEDYAEQACGIKQRQAYSYISAYEKLGEEFIIKNAELGITKLELISQVSSYEREEFLESVDVENASTRDLKEEVQKYKNQIEQLTFELETEKEESKVKDMNEKIASDTIAALKAEIKKLKSKPTEVAIAEVDETTIKNAVAEAEAKAEEKISKLKQELKTAKEKTKQAEASKASAVQEAKENAIKEANKKIDKLVADGKEKDAKLQDAIKAAKVAGADEDTIAVRILFNDLQSTANELKKHISVIQNKDPEKADKLTATISKTMLSLFGNVD